MSANILIGTVVVGIRLFDNSLTVDIFAGTSDGTRLVKIQLELNRFCFLS